MSGQKNSNPKIVNPEWGVGIIWQYNSLQQKNIAVVNIIPNERNHLFKNIAARDKLEKKVTRFINKILDEISTQVQLTAEITKLLLKELSRTDDIYRLFGPKNQRIKSEKEVIGVYVAFYIAQQSKKPESKLTDDRLAVPPGIPEVQSSILQQFNDATKQHIEWIEEMSVSNMLEYLQQQGQNSPEIEEAVRFTVENSPESQDFAAGVKKIIEEFQTEIRQEEALRRLSQHDFNNIIMQFKQMILKLHEKIFPPAKLVPAADTSLQDLISAFQARKKTPTPAKTSNLVTKKISKTASSQPTSAPPLTDDKKSTPSVLPMQKSDIAPAVTSTPMPVLAKEEVKEQKSPAVTIVNFSWKISLDKETVNLNLEQTFSEKVSPQQNKQKKSIPFNPQDEKQCAKYVIDKINHAFFLMGNGKYEDAEKKFLLALKCLKEWAHLFKDNFLPILGEISCNYYLSQCAKNINHQEKERLYSKNFLDHLPKLIGLLEASNQADEIKRLQKIAAQFQTRTGDLQASISKKNADLQEAEKVKKASLQKTEKVKKLSLALRERIVKNEQYLLGLINDDALDKALIEQVDTETLTQKWVVLKSLCQTEDETTRAELRILGSRINVIITHKKTIMDIAKTTKQLKNYIEAAAKEFTEINVEFHRLTPADSTRKKLKAESHAAADKEIQYTRDLRALEEIASYLQNPESVKPREIKAERRPLQGASAPTVTITTDPVPFSSEILPSRANFSGSYAQMQQSFQQELTTEEKEDRLRTVEAAIQATMLPTRSTTNRVNLTRLSSSNLFSPKQTRFGEPMSITLPYTSVFPRQVETSATSPTQLTPKEREERLETARAGASEIMLRAQK